MSERGWVRRPGMPGPPVLTLVAPWLPAGLDPLRLEIIGRAFGALGILEEPPGSNRGPEIDAYNRAAGSPLGSYWCANALASWWQAVGASVPPSRRGSCDEWVKWAKAAGRWFLADGSYQPLPGDAVFYGEPGDAVHAGVVVRTDPLVLTIEGNTGLGGHTRNGVAVDLKEMNASWALGFIQPKAVAI